MYANIGIALAIIVVIFALVFFILYWRRGKKISSLENELKKRSRKGPGYSFNNRLWLSIDDPVYYNENDTRPYCTVAELMQCKLTEAEFLEIPVIFHAASDSGRLLISTQNGDVWVEPVNRASRYTVLQVQPEDQDNQ